MMVSGTSVTTCCAWRLLHMLFVLAFTAAASIRNPMEQNNDDIPLRQDLACVTLRQYSSRTSCDGDPVSIRNNTVWTTPGMPCKHSDRMGANSVTDQFCQLAQAEFHQTVYVKSTDCKVAWYQKAYSPMKLTYSVNSCTYGYNILACTAGPCEHPTPPTDGMLGVDGLEDILQESESLSE